MAKGIRTRVKEALEGRGYRGLKIKLSKGPRDQRLVWLDVTHEGTPMFLHMRRHDREAERLVKAEMEAEGLSGGCDVWGG
jgi:hypothetical protein